ncbi:hypothetical protein GC163_21530 [bacterium]|nr:hypothetical protein [bacterium]
MWSIDDNSSPETVEWIRSAGRLPVVYDDFRAQVMAAAVESQQRGSTWRRYQASITSILAVSLLFVLPAYCRFSIVTGSLPPEARVKMSLPATSSAGETYEWRLVESFQEFRDQSARAIRGTL